MILPSKDEYDNDEFTVAVTSDGALSGTKVYKDLSNVDGELVDEGWMMLWCLNVSESVNTFMWLIKHD